MTDAMGGGILVFLACGFAALLLAVGFGIAICRGARFDRRHPRG